jgi:inner membrane transporter RhtA
MESPGLGGLALAVAAAAVLTAPFSVMAAADLRGADDALRFVAIGVLGVAVPYALEYIALRFTSLRAFGVLLSLDPGVAALAGLIWLGQTLTARDAVGLVLVIVASVGATTMRAPADH